MNASIPTNGCAAGTALSPDIKKTKGMKRGIYWIARKWAAIAAAAFTLAACDEDGFYPESAPRNGDIECLVLNEGVMNTNTGAISVVYRDSSVAADAFQDANQRPMGDVAQSLALINGKYFVTLDNSKKVEVVDPATFRSLGTILYTQAGYPRQIVAISETEAIVSDLRNQLVRIRTVEPYGEPLEYIPVPAWIEQMLVADGKLFGMTTRGILVFDTDDIAAEKARLLQEVRNEEYTKTCRLLKDKNGMVWALTNSKNGNRVAGITLACVDPAREEVVRTHTLPVAEAGTAREGEVVGHVNYNRTDIDPTGTYIYFNVKTKTAAPDEEGRQEQQSVWRMNVDTGEFEPYRDLPGVEMMYGFAVGPTGDVYICDCLDYTAQRGYVRCYRRDGTADSRKVGIYPCQVYFPGYEY